MQGLLRRAGGEAGADGDEVLRKLFFQLDADEDGLINEAEFLEAVGQCGSAFDKLNAEEQKQIFKIADTKGNGMINLEDFAQWIGVTKENLSYFQLVDSDSDGHITEDEWRSVIDKMQLDLTEEAIVKTFNRADLNNDGQMSFIEFFKYMNGITDKEGVLKRMKSWIGQKLR
uniref:EF-hand domain-containing protein n=1 Tax=Alexandrium catenella TaxID=2925 RepID=A0A7S1RRF8_ALECA